MQFKLAIPSARSLLGLEKRRVRRVKAKLGYKRLWDRIF